MLVWKLGLIFLGYLLINIGLLLLIFYKEGKIIKNNIAFATIQLYTVIMSILLMCQNNTKVEGYILAAVFLASGIGSIIIKQKDFFLARIITFETFILVNIAPWVTTIQGGLILISLITFGGTYIARNNYLRRGY